MNTKNRFQTHYLFFFITFIVSILLAVESYTHINMPGQSILELFHQYGYFTKVPVVYKPGKGLWHRAGWLGSGLMIVMMAYSLRKRIPFMMSLGRLEAWLNIHIFLGLIATVLVTSHTTLKLGGIVSICFWLMLITTLSGIVGRYIYVQIPRGISGNELRIDEIDQIIREINTKLKKYPNVDNLIESMTKSEEILAYGENKINPLSLIILMVKRDIVNMRTLRRLKYYLKSQSNISSKETLLLLALCKEKVRLNKRLNLLSASHRIFHYWHILHLPISIIMFVIMFVHIAITSVFKVY